MTREDIIRMAREAGFAAANYPSLVADEEWATLERFAALIASRVAAAEREACAKECDELAGILFCHGDKEGAELAVSLRDTIRARGQT